ncbi:MAG TPA: iron-containing alcohol dehydrogenase [Ktedonobacteraceae bacterium]|nr:iron-containing alcohol dehydrogenase [Ktedonobacteraceae bacterium]
MHEFRYTSYAQEIIFGPGSISRLDEAIERYSWQRLMLCSTGSLRRDGTIASIEKALGDRLVATHEHVQPHVPDFQVAEALTIASQNKIDALIGLGGGSPIGLAKAVSLALEEQRSGRPARSTSPTDQPLVPVIAIPTTYAGSEMTPVYGITQHTDGLARKITVTDSKITPKLVIYDPLLTLNLPPTITASTGINALAHCIEALYSVTRNPLSTAAATSGTRHITSALPRCYATADDVEARAEMLIGAYLAGTALASVTMALHHGLCHVLGGTAGVPHGIANSIILPHAMRFNLDATASQLALAAQAMGISLAGRSAEIAVEEAIQRIYALIAQMNLPQHLREVGVQEADLPHLAQLAFQSRAVQNNPKPITDPAQLEALLRAAW